MARTIQSNEIRRDRLMSKLYEQHKRVKKTPTAEEIHDQQMEKALIRLQQVQNISSRECMRYIACVERARTLCVPVKAIKIATIHRASIHEVNRTGGGGNF